MARQLTDDRESGSAALDGVVDMRVLELLTARLCHELSGPLAAINNGIELLAEEETVLGFSPESSFVRDAVALVSGSAGRAGSRLQFYRFAYGSANPGASLGPPPLELARGLFEATRIACDFADGVRALAPRWQKLACNLLPIGADALPRGGHLALSDIPLSIEALGEGAALSPEAHAALMLKTAIGELTARTVQPYFAGLLARTLDCRLRVTTAPGRVRLSVIVAD
jgi:histidine phosphotransferase ChpT